ncbi:MAG: glycoside hydrolase family 3 C-terminal domain-containing protein [Anaerolineae bacterium]|nr:glycoside hydrolase family 3 C-terminal domain-containing protein [Anaerolineae bacterium]
MMDLQAIREQMTLEEKAALCTGASPWTTVPVERLNIPVLRVADGPHGVRRIVETGSLVNAKSLPATCFPTASALASSWDRDLLYELGQALADECIALGVDVLLGPGNNMKRSPLCGRNFEYYSEDPCLGGEMAASFINGVQSKGVGVSLKHYAANNQEHERLTINAVVDERALREIYLAGFEIAVKKAKPWTVMCAYNRLNGPYCSEHKQILTDILKEEWGFEGFVVSDWGAVHDRVASLAGGLDLEMPGPRDYRVQQVIDAVKSGELDEAALNESVGRLLTIIFKAAETEKGHTEIDIEGHHALARKIAGETMVLLKNQGDILPLKDVTKLAVIGRGAKEAHFQGGGSSHINPTRVDVPFDELAKLAGGAELLYAAGYPEEDGLDPALIDEAVALAKQAEVALLYLALPTYKESEGYDRKDIDLTAQQVALIKAVAAAQPKTVVILNNGAPVAMSEWIGDAAAVLEAWMMGQAGGGAIADVLFGKVNPSGKLAETFPLRLEDTPAYLNFPGENGEVRYGEGLFIGYRYYDAKALDVLFPFGYGLSYTSFAYSNFKLSAAKLTDAGSLTVSVDVTNTGSMAGKATVQVYVHDPESRLARPYKELKGFAKVALEPGATQTATITLDARAFAYYDPAYGRWVTESGAFDILVGSSSADIHFKETVQMESTQELPCILHADSSLRDWLSDPRGAAALQSLMQQFSAALSDEAALGMVMDEFMQQLPLASILHFLGGMEDSAPEEIVAGLLAQVHAG